MEKNSETPTENSYGFLVEAFQDTNPFIQLAAHLIFSKLDEGTKAIIVKTFDLDSWKDKGLLDAHPTVQWINYLEEKC